MVAKVPKNYSELEKLAWWIKGKNDEETPRQLNIELDEGLCCPKHNSLIHSYQKSNNTLLCSQCIMQDNIAKASVAPLAQVVKNFRGQLLSHDIKISQQELQIKKFRELISTISGHNR